MNADRLLQHFERISEAPDAIERLRRFILDLAVRGKLVEQDHKDEPASELLKRIHAEMSRVVTTGGARRGKPTVRFAPEDLPFPIPQGWQWSQLAEIGLISPRNNADGASLASFVPMTLIPAAYGIPHQHEVRPWSEFKTGYTHFAEGDVGLAKITPCYENGKSTVFRGLKNGFGAGTTELHIVRPLLINADYVLLFLKCPHFIESGISRMTGTAGQKRVPTNYFAFSPFPLPPIPEQDRIVAKVDELMALCDELEAAKSEREQSRDRLVRASLQRLNQADDEDESFGEHADFTLNHVPRLTVRVDHIKQLRQTILNLAVRGKLVPQDSTEEPASALHGRLIAEIGSFAAESGIATPRVNPVTEQAVPFAAPPGWIWARLASMFRVITDGDHQPPPRSESGVAFLTIGNVTTGHLDFSNCRFVTEDYFDAIAPHRRPTKGDFLYTVVGATYGRPALVETDRPFCVQRHIGILKPTSEIDLGYLHLLLSSPLIYGQATRSLTGTAQPTIPLRPLRNFLAPLPPLAEQHRIVAKVDELMALCGRLEARLISTEADSRRLLEAVLHEALTAPTLAEAA